MKQVMIVKPGTLSATDKGKLTKTGVVVIEHPFPGDVRLIDPEPAIPVDMILNAAARAIKNTGASDVKIRFAEYLAVSIAGDKGETNEPR